MGVRREACSDSMEAECLVKFSLRIVSHILGQSVEDVSDGVQSQRRRVSATSHILSIAVHCDFILDGPIWSQKNASFSGN